MTPPDDHEFVGNKTNSPEHENERSSYAGNDAVSSASPPPFQLKSSPSGLPEDTLNQMSGAFGQDFSGVNIHADSQSAVDSGALAYTQGQDIHFAPGQYDPKSQSGQELIGHELTHVVQQNEGRVQANNQVNGMPLNDDHGLEKEADEMGEKVAQHKSATADTPPEQNNNMSGSSAIQRSSAIKGSTMQRWKWPWENDAPADPAKDPAKKDLKKVKLAGSNKGTNFDTTVAIPGPEPAVGTVKIQLKIALNFLDCTMDNLKTHAVFDAGNLKSWEKEIKKAKKASPDSLKWNDKEKTKFKTDYQKSVTDVWSTDASKLSYKLNNPEYEKYHLKNNVELMFTDKDPHEKINTIKMLPTMNRLRSYRGDEDLFDSRDVSEKEKRTVAKSYLAEQIGEFETGKSALTPGVTAKIDAFAGKAKKIMEAHKKDTPAPSWNLEVRGRASKGGSKSFNKKISTERASKVSDEIFTKVPDLSSGTSGGTGFENTEKDTKYQRVEVILSDSNMIDIEQNVAAHETGHMFGLGDEYSDETTAGALKKSTGDEADETSQAIRDAGMGEAEVEEHRVNQHNDSIMNSGSVVSRGHYSFFLIKLKEIATDETSGAQVNWDVTKT